MLTSAHRSYYIESVRTTVDLDEDVLRVARHLAEERRQSLGRVLSDLVRKGIQPSAKLTVRSGKIPVLPRKLNGAPVTSRAVKDLQETEV